MDKKWVATSVQTNYLYKRRARAYNFFNGNVKVRRRYIHDR